MKTCVCLWHGGAHWWERTAEVEVEGSSVGGTSSSLIAALYTVGPHSLWLLQRHPGPFLPFSVNLMVS